MIPVSLSLRNFLSYGEDVPPLDFTGFHVACISGPNGHGKSAILDAITWALWSEARKAGTERKPDAGLLRIGSTEMQVAFEFDLEGVRYRVSRAYRRSKRSAASSLDLQVFDPVTRRFKALSEENSVRKTQQRLNLLLRMNYDTFINSAFIIQGHADEFTRRSARERKHILGEILALSRYDDLNGLARTHSLQAEQAAESIRLRLRDIESATSNLEDHRNGVEAASERIRILEAALADSEAKLKTLLREKARLDLRQAEWIESKKEKVRLDADQIEAEALSEAIRTELSVCRGVLQDREKILKDCERHTSLRVEEEVLQQKRFNLHALEKRQNELERRILECRHALERRLTEVDLRLSSAERGIAEADEALRCREEVQSGLSELEAARFKEKELSALRAERESLERQLRDRERRLEVVCAELQAALHTRIGQHDRLKQLADQIPELEKAEREARQHREERRRLEERRDRLRSANTVLESDMEVARARQDDLSRAIGKTETQRSALEQAGDQPCPLCGSSLDDQHRTEVGAELDGKLDEMKTGLAQLAHEVSVAEAKRGELRRNEEKVDLGLAQHEGAEAGLARADTALRQAQRAVEEMSSLEPKILELKHLLREANDSGPQALCVKEVKKKIDSLDYDPEAHRCLRGRIESLIAFEARQAVLLEAEQRRTSGKQILPGLRQEAAKVRAALDEMSYAPEAQKEYKTVEQEIHALNYDTDLHARVTRELKILADAPARRERLLASEREAEAAKSRLCDQENRARKLAERGEAISRLMSELQESISTRETIEKEVPCLEDAIQEKRVERDLRLQEKVTHQVQYERCLALKESVRDEQQRLNHLSKECRIYKGLTAAFGKDGIQALIIDQAIPEIEDEANRILARLSDNGAQITLESLRDLKTGGTSETLDIQISDELGVRPYELYSGGEAFRIDFAVRIALSKLLARRAGTRLSTLVIDEGFGTQDQEGLSKLIEAIQTISQDFEKILVVTHVESLKTAFPVHIQVTKHPHIGSRFELG